MILERPIDEQQSLKEYFKKENLFDMLYEGLISESEEMRNMASKEFLYKRKRISFDFKNSFVPDQYVEHLSNENQSVRTAALTVLLNFSENGGYIPIEHLCNQISIGQYDEVFKLISLINFSNEKISNQEKILDSLIEVFQDPSKKKKIFFLIPVCLKIEWGNSKTRYYAISLLELFSNLGRKRIIKCSLDMIKSGEKNIHFKYSAFRVTPLSSFF